MFEKLKEFKSHLVLVGFFIALGTSLFAKIDAYAEGKVNEGVEKLKGQTDKKLDKMHEHIDILTVKQEAQGEQLKRMEDKQDHMIDLLLEKNHGRK